MLSQEVCKACIDKHRLRRGEPDLDGFPMRVSSPWDAGDQQAWDLGHVICPYRFRGHDKSKVGS